MLSVLFRRFKKKPVAVKVLVVCMENICRSPMAEGALKRVLSERGLSDLVKVESAGVLASQPGSRPDVRAIKIAQSRGVSIKGIRSRIVTAEDYHNYGYILGVDNEVLSILSKKKLDYSECEVLPLMSFVKNSDTFSEIPDPYFGNNAGFEHVMDLVELAAEDFVSYLVDNDL